MHYVIPPPWEFEMWLCRLSAANPHRPLLAAWQAVVWLRCAWAADPGTLLILPLIGASALLLLGISVFSRRKKIRRSQLRPVNISVAPGWRERG